jgi:hypothetical protein
MTKHNKKRNVGIIYELFTRHITSLVIEGKKKEVKKATKILERRFKKGTELYKEFRLFNALVNVSVSSQDKAVIVVENAKKEILRIDNKKLNQEKSKLIKEINYELKDKDFYYRSIPYYREYANLQNLFNEWRKKDHSNLKNLIEKEEKAISWLLCEKKVIEETSTDVSSTSSLVLNIMNEKINKKYVSLTKDQKQIIRNYALYSDTDKERFKSFLVENKAKALKEIENFKIACDNQIILEKIDNVKNKIQSLNVEPNSDQEIIKFLTVSSLINELKEN